MTKLKWKKTGSSTGLCDTLTLRGGVDEEETEKGTEMNSKGGGKKRVINGSQDFFF